MNKTIKSIYEAPDMMVQTMALGGMLCASNYGESGAAATGFDSSNITNYETSF